MPGGRPSKPTHLKVLHGDDKKNPQRVNHAEPVPASEEVRPPATLTPEGLAVWRRLAPDRQRQGVLTPWDVDAFALFCEAVAVAHHAAAYAAEHIDDRIVPGAQSPVSRMREAVAICATLGGRFGWTPSDRAKLAVGGENRDQKERLLS
jgi:P27 family predicted phage terminase small subunit